MLPIRKKIFSETKSILVLTLSQEKLGDGMVKLPFIQGLRHLFPSAHITWVCNSSSSYTSSVAPLVNGLLDEVIDNAGVGQSIWECLFPQFHRSFDLIIDTQKKPRITWSLKQLPHRFFLSATAWWAFSHLKPPPFPPSPHFSARYMRFLDALTGTPHKTMHYEVNIPSSDLHQAEHLRFKAAHNKRGWLLLAPGAGEPQKCWPLERFIHLSKQLQKEGWAISYLLGPQEKDFLLPLQHADPTASFPLQAWENLSIFSTLALGHVAQASVTNDTGTGHVLAATPISLITLFGDSNLSLQWAPLPKKGICLKGENGINSLSLEVVHNTLVSFLPSH